MDRKDRISPNAMNVLGGGSRKNNKQHSAHEPSPASEPEKGGWWDRFKDKAKKLCTGFKEFCVEAKELLAVATGVLVGVVALRKAISKNEKFGKKKDKDSRKKSHKRTRGAQSINFINYGTVIWV
jgi:hypothetical protein